MNQVYVLELTQSGTRTESRLCTNNHRGYWGSDAAATNACYCSAI